ncbi:MAG: hypothetical protein Q8N06_22095 [Hydrogenophaga sp.]|uniref:hypothetical protein n=1 Tax=Polaromonas sp. AET17H-212 TaxID=1977061 RepID=UPI0011437FB2|nr:hypothetical protein [Polaromonas sp. AET17H-212]MDP3168136.1 hypothetical protein [Hydrogenophaga sp.]MDP3309686.1 hypothetical protein [Polaromonas sp.]
MSQVINFDRSKATSGGGVRIGGSGIWPLSGLSQTSPGAWLDATIDGKAYASVALSLWTHHPQLRAATERLGVLLTPMWPTLAGDSLLACAIENAVTKVDAAVRRGESYEGRVVAIYLYWLANCVAEVARLAVYGENTDGQLLRWRYFSEPLHSWALAHGMKELETVLVAEQPTVEEVAGLRIHLIARLTDDPVDAGYLELLAPRG